MCKSPTAAQLCTTSRRNCSRLCVLFAGIGEGPRQPKSLETAVDMIFGSAAATIAAFGLKVLRTSSSTPNLLFCLMLGMSSIAGGAQCFGGFCTARQKPRICAMKSWPPSRAGSSEGAGILASPR